MSGERVVEAAMKYLVALDEWGVAAQWPSDNDEHVTPDRMQHVRWMCHQIIQFVAEDRIEKAMRWLGFVQGVLWAESRFTIEEMKDHNRPV